jgi:hypothetical protein
MFQPSEELARLIVAAQREPPDVPRVAALMAEDAPTPGLRRINVTSRYVPLYDRQVNLDVVRDAVTERPFGLLGTLARRHASLYPSSEKLLLMPERPLRAGAVVPCLVAALPARRHDVRRRLPQPVGCRPGRPAAAPALPARATLVLVGADFTW